MQKLYIHFQCNCRTGDHVPLSLNAKGIIVNRMWIVVVDRLTFTLVFWVFTCLKWIWPILRCSYLFVIVQDGSCIVRKIMGTSLVPRAALNEQKRCCQRGDSNPCGQSPWEDTSLNEEAIAHLVAWVTRHNHSATLTIGWRQSMLQKYIVWHSSGRRVEASEKAKSWFLHI